MDDRAVWQPPVGARAVMVAENYVDSCRPGGSHLLDGGDPAVDRYQQPGAACGEALDGRLCKPVAVVDPVRQEPTDVPAERTHRADHDRARADPVHVVVTVNGDPGARPDVMLDQRDRLLDVSERTGVVGLARVQELPGQTGVAEAAANEQLRDDMADPELALERQR